MSNAFLLGASVSADLKISWHPGMGAIFGACIYWPLVYLFRYLPFSEVGDFTIKTFLALFHDYGSNGTRMSRDQGLGCNRTG